MKFLLVFLVFISAALANEPVDRLSLASILLKNGHLRRAEVVLKEYADSGIENKKRFNLLQGLYYLKSKKFKEALSYLDLAIKFGEESPFVQVYRAQAYYFLEQYQKTITILSQLDLKELNVAKLVVLKSKSHWNLGELEQAFKVLDYGDQNFKSHLFEKTRISYLLEKKLFVVAMERTVAFLKKENAPASAYIELAMLFKKQGANDSSKILLEVAHLEDPENTEVLKQLGKTYYQDQMLLSAAWMFEKSSYYDSQNIVYAIDLYRKLGMYYKAEFLESQVPEQKEREKQKFITALENKKFNYVPILFQRLKKKGELEDELKYAMAYGLFRSGELKQSQTLLSEIMDPSYADKAIKMRQLIQECFDKKWECHEKL